MDIVIGPVLKRSGGYGFDVWTAAQGLTRGYPYRRIEDAYYAWRAEIRASAQGRIPAMRIPMMSPADSEMMSPGDTK